MAKGRSLPLSLARRLVTDFVHASLRVPTICMERRMRLGPLAIARDAAVPRPGWCAVFTKALAIVSSRTAALRRVYLSFPWPRIFESATNFGAVTLERPMAGETGVGIIVIKAPETRSIGEVHAAIMRGKVLPENQIGEHRRALRIARLPRPMRRFAWWLGLNVWGRQRTRHFGTFGVTAPANSGATLVQLLSPLTAMLTYGMVDSNGEVDVRLTFDHRIMDGCDGGRVLTQLENVLSSELREELLALRTASAA